MAAAIETRNAAEKRIANVLRIITEYSPINAFILGGSGPPGSIGFPSFVRYRSSRR
jgi:hypothetical protein